jgi:hypothetical protein
MVMKKIARIIKYFGAVVTCFCIVGLLFISFNGSRSRNDYWGVYFFVMSFETFLGLVLWNLADELGFDRRYSYTPPIFLLKSPDKTATKRLKINLELPMWEEEEVRERIFDPLEEAWRWTQNKKSKFHKEYLATYYSLAPCLEEIAEALAAWSEQYVECTSEEERERLKNELKQALSKNGAIRKVRHYIMLQMNAIKIKEEQYQEDVREAERSLADVTPAAPAPTPRKDVFAGIENFESSLNEMDDLIHKYNEPKKKVKKKK